MHPGTPSTGSAHAASRRAGSRRSLLRIATAAALTLPLVLAACGGGSKSTTAEPTKSAEPVELSVYYWGDANRATLTQKVFDLYTQKHPNVTFKPEYGPNQGYTDKLNTRIASGTAPDIYQTDDGMAADYAKRNAAYDLTPLIKNKKINTAKISKALLDYGATGGKNYSIPIAENTPATVYNESLVKQYGLDEPQIGWTLDQWIQWGVQVNTKSNGAVKGIMDGSADYRPLWVWLRQQGKELYTADGKLGVTVDDMKKWFDIWAAARQEKATPDAATLHTANAGTITTQLVATKKAAASFVWSNQLAALQKATTDQLAITSNPGDPKGQWPRAALYWNVYKGTKHADVAADVISFFINDPDAAKILGAERGLPANTDNRTLINSSLGAADQLSVAYENTVSPKFGKAPPLPPAGHVTLRQKLIDAAESVEFGKATTDVAAQTFITAATTAIGG